MNNNNNNKRMLKLYNLVFNNIYLKKLINHYIYLYKINEFKSIKRGIKNTLLEEEKNLEFISTLEINQMVDGFNILNKLDLHINGVLNKVIFRLSNFSQFNNGNGDYIIPMGVEILEFYFPIYSEVKETIPFSTLPSSIHTIKNAFISSNFEHCVGIGDENLRKNKKIIKIPNNIKTISFKKCNTTLYNDKYYSDNQWINSFLDIRNGSIKTLEFDEFWDNGKLELLKGDIPETITFLNLGNYCIKNLNESVIPSSVLKLSIINDGKKNDTDYFNSLISSKIQTLSISYYGLPVILTTNSNLNKCESITSLSLDLGFGRKMIEPFSLNAPNLKYLSLKISTTIFDFQENFIPSTVTNLNLELSVNTILSNFKNFIPNNVTNLKLNTTFNQENFLPQSITHLDLDGEHVGKKLKENINIMISNLSNLISLNLPNCFEDLRLNLPKTIKKINYIN